jgi:signal transduction histidine kinase
MTTRCIRHIDLYQIFAALVNCLVGLAVVYLGKRADIVTISGVSACIIFAFFVLRLRISYAVIATMIYVTAYEISLLAIAHNQNTPRSVNGSADIPVLSFVLWMIESLCIAGGYFWERTTRHLFLANKEIEQQKLIAEAAIKAKSEFLANINHEIRTPMNAIMGMTYLAMRTDLSIHQRDYLDKIQSSTQSLLGSIDEILNFSKGEARKLDIGDIDRGKQ